MHLYIPTTRTIHTNKNPPAAAARERMEEEEEAQKQAKLHIFLQWLQVQTPLLFLQNPKTLHLLTIAHMQVNGAELRGCNIKSCGSNKGFGVFCSDKSIEQQRTSITFSFISLAIVSDFVCDFYFPWRLLGVVFVVPLDLAITPMRVLEDPTLGPKCRAMFEEGDVDDRLLMMLFLAVERVRKNSSWKPYVFINMLV